MLLKGAPSITNSMPKASFSSEKSIPPFCNSGYKRANTAPNSAESISLKLLVFTPVKR
jgi:hypothetical protein